MLCRLSASLSRDMIQLRPNAAKARHSILEYAFELALHFALGLPSLVDSKLSKREEVDASSTDAPAYA